MLDELFDSLKVKMTKVIDHYLKEMTTIRTGRASTSLLDSIKVDYYGTLSPINNIAHVSTPDSQNILVQPFDPSSLEAIEKAIISSDIGLNPNNDGNMIRLTIPALTDERRGELVKLVHKYIEDGRIAIRNIRREGNDTLKKNQKEHHISDDDLKKELDNVQEMTDEYIAKLNEIQNNKEQEILN